MDRSGQAGVNESAGRPYGRNYCARMNSLRTSSGVYNTPNTANSCWVPVTVFSLHSFGLDAVAEAQEVWLKLKPGSALIQLIAHGGASSQLSRATAGPTSRNVRLSPIPHLAPHPLPHCQP